MDIKTLRDLFTTELCLAYDCEQKLVKKGLPAMIKESNSPELRQALEQHLKETEIHVRRLEQVFGAMAEEPEAEDNDVLEEMMSATKDCVGDIDKDAPAVRDAALIASGNKVEHYEIATYGTLLAFARQLNLPQVVRELEQTLSEEKAADAKLTQIGESSVNARAAQANRAASA